MKIRVEMLPEDVANGVQHDCARCPVALALRRAAAPVTTHANRLFVSRFRLLICSGAVGLNFFREVTTFPRAVTDWTRDFDSADVFDRAFIEPLAPFDLELALPWEAALAP